LCSKTRCSGNRPRDQDSLRRALNQYVTYSQTERNHHCKQTSAVRLTGLTLPLRSQSFADRERSRPTELKSSRQAKRSRFLAPGRFQIAHALLAIVDPQASLIFYGYHCHTMIVLVSADRTSGPPGSARQRLPQHLHESIRRLPASCRQVWPVPAASRGLHCRVLAHDPNHLHVSRKSAFEDPERIEILRGVPLRQPTITKVVLA
jgi:hypothetical protein